MQTSKSYNVSAISQIYGTWKSVHASRGAAVKDATPLKFVYDKSRACGASPEDETRVFSLFIFSPKRDLWKFRKCSTFYDRSPRPRATLGRQPDRIANFLIRHGEIGHRAAPRARRAPAAPRYTPYRLPTPALFAGRLPSEELDEHNRYY
ncbi:hypothetical protein EVAR_20461_1 [Eumeta japonica]|uniref:Uncharacterized protein n=1 Tax=Eumeta variegata TaxID=151549 RepID=A0A4C1TY04_EUMVA|nr:hypothetical protein EVAR_20461_1 [Eumeta japonica]